MKQELNKLLEKATSTIEEVRQLPLVKRVSKDLLWKKHYKLNLHLLNILKKMLSIKLYSLKETQEGQKHSVIVFSTLKI